jgi:hypothetical protein
MTRLLTLLSAITLLSTATTTHATTLHLTLTHSSLLDPSTLPCSTHATLYGNDNGKRFTAPLRTDNSFTFGGLEAGEYLLDVHARDFVFPCLRVDVFEDKEDEGYEVLPPNEVEGHAQQQQQQEAKQGKKEKETVAVHLIHPSNKWHVKGAKMAASTASLSNEDEMVKVSISALAKKNYYEAREGFDLLAFFKSPMILMGVLSMGLVFGMPYLMENSEFFFTPSY